MSKGRALGGMELLCARFLTYVRAESEIQLIYVNTNRFVRKRSSFGSVGLFNLLNAILVFITVLARSFQIDAKVLIYTGDGYAFLRDVILASIIGDKAYLYHHSEPNFLKYGKAKSVLKLLKHRIPSFKTLIIGDTYRSLYVSHGFKVEKLMTPIALKTGDLDMAIRGEVKNTLDILYVGSIDSNKGLHLLIASAIYSEYFYRVHVYGPIREEKYFIACKKYAKFYNVELIYYGQKSNEEILNLRSSNFSLYVLPSYSEALPLSLVEAFNAGFKIVSSKVGYIEEYFGSKLLYFEKGNAYDLARCINDALKSEGREEVNSKIESANTWLAYNQSLLEALGLQ